MWEQRFHEIGNRRRGPIIIAKATVSSLLAGQKCPTDSASNSVLRNVVSSRIVGLTGREIVSLKASESGNIYRRRSGNWTSHGEGSGARPAGIAGLGSEAGIEGNRVGTGSGTAGLKRKANNSEMRSHAPVNYHNNGNHPSVGQDKNGTGEGRCTQRGFCTHTRSAHSGRNTPIEHLDDVPDRPVTPVSDDEDPQHHRHQRRPYSPNRPRSPGSSSGIENLLAIKQNMLAQASLTTEENLVRKKIESEEPMSDSSPEDHVTEQRRTQESSAGGMTLCDIEDEDYGFDPVERSGGDNGNKGLGMLDIRKPIIDGRPVLKPIDAQTWRDLKNVVVGPNGVLQEGWLGQGFNFDSNILYGLVQKRGGPCGVLAAVQALLLRNLIFGSPICDDEELPVPDVSVLFSKDAAATRTLTFRRTKALVCALAEILWRCGKSSIKPNNEQQQQQRSLWDFKVVNRVEEGGSSAVICFSDASIGTDLRIFDRLVHLKNFIHGNLQKFDCVSLVYSAVLSRGIQQVQDDFDFPNCPLLGSHGYCSQELVNLLTTGRAISNVFDNQITLDDKVLKGIETRCDVGLLSLFEHYDSCQVGTNLKTPKFPIWIVCSESHFSVLFATNPSVVSDNADDLEKFEIYYYDGLARQQNHIRLVIELDGTAVPSPRYPHRVRIQAGSSATSFNINDNNNNNNGSDGDEELVPPLEKCIRTKWKGARVDWNETEPIL